MCHTFLVCLCLFFLYIPLLRSFLQHVGDAGIFVPQLLQLWPSLSSKRMHYSNERRSHVKCAAESYFVYVHLIRDGRMTFSTPASTSSQTSLILFTPTSHQLDPSDTWSNREKWSTPLSNVTVPGLPRGEQLLNFEINSLLSPALFLLLLQYDGNYMIPYYIFFFLSEVRKLERIQLHCTAQSTKPDDFNRLCIYTLIFTFFFLL